MAKVMTTRTVPEHTREDHTGYICELCSCEYDEDWDADIYEREEPKVSYRSGNSYPEGDFTKTIILDICPKCFIEKLIPWFESLGGKARQEDHW